jgi:hypothetical protein
MSGRGWSRPLNVNACQPGPAPKISRASGALGAETLLLKLIAEYPLTPFRPDTPWWKGIHQVSRSKPPKFACQQSRLP